jgi:hypothetical protein
MSTPKPPAWYWICAVAGLLWNLLGLVAFLMQAFWSESALASMSDAEQQFYLNYPHWALTAFGLAVAGGVLGCVFLLLRKLMARFWLVVSLLAVLVQYGYNTYMVLTPQYAELRNWVMTAAVILIAALLIRFAVTARKHGWLA